MRTFLRSVLSSLVLLAGIYSGVLFAASAESKSMDSQFIPKWYVKTTHPRLSVAKHHALKSKPRKIVTKKQPLKIKSTKVVRHRVKPTHYSKQMPHWRRRPLSYATVYPGSLRQNIQRIAGKYGWHRVIWRLSKDYRWVGKTRLSGYGLNGILVKLLKSYPVQAQLYEGNHILVIVPRALQ